MKYFIVPATSVAGEVEAESREDAMVDFAATMDLDMNAYFKAVTKEEMEKAELPFSEEPSRKAKTLGVVIDDSDDPCGSCHMRESCTAEAPSEYCDR